MTRNEQRQQGERKEIRREFNERKGGRERVREVRGEINNR